MDDIVKDENILKNGNPSVLSSSDSVDVVIHQDSSETSASDLPPSSGYRPIKNSTTDSSLATTSGAATDTTFDLSTTVNSSESPVSSDYSGTRFVVKRMLSSDLQQFSSTSSSSSRAERTPSQSPKSVKFVVEKESPVKSPSRKSPTKKSPKKNCGLTKSITTGAMSELLDPKELFSPMSEDSITSKEDIELPTLSRGNVKPKRREERSDEDEIRILDPDRSKEPLLAMKNVTGLSDSETDLLNRTQELTDVRRTGGLMGTLSVEDIPTTPLTTSHSGATTNSDAACENCILKSTFIYIGGIIGLIIGVVILLIVLFEIGYFQSDSKPTAEQLGNGTPSTTGILKTATQLFNASTSVDELFTTQLPTTPNEPTFDTNQETDTVMTITNSPNIDDQITETTTNIPSIDLPTTATHN